MWKKIIFCFDGTANDPSDAGDFVEDLSISNVLKLHLFFGGGLPGKDGKTLFPGQRSFYYSGIGTRGRGVFGMISNAINKMIAPPGGDVSEIMTDAVEDLDKYYENGDQIFIFGFSRGAAIARMFAAKLGVLDREVEFLGVFDTVAAIKGSLDLKRGIYPVSGIIFENGTIGKHIKKAVHLVAIDEKRIAFQPTLFNKSRRVMEVWFAGVHSDIGGGYWADGLSDITLDFMGNTSKSSGLQMLVGDEDKIPYSHLKDDEGKRLKICFDDLDIKPSYYAPLHEQKRAGFLTGRTLASRFLRVNVDDKPQRGSSLLPEMLPIIHHTVCDRFRHVPGYCPYSIRGINYRVMDDDRKVVEVRRGMAGLS